MRSSATRLFTLAIAVLLSASGAAAQSIAEPRTWTLTPFLHTSAGVGDPAPDDSLGLGIAFAYDLTANLGFEGELSHLFDVAGDTAEIDWSISNFSANAVYHFDVQRVTPYATFGLGLERSGYSLKTDGAANGLLDPSATEFSFNFGGGVKYPLNDRWLVRADLRRFQSNDLAPDYWRLYGGVTFWVRR